MRIRVSPFQQFTMVYAVLMFLAGCGAEEATPVVAAKGIVKINGTAAANIIGRVVAADGSVQRWPRFYGW